MTEINSPYLRVSRPKLELAGEVLRENPPMLVMYEELGFIIAGDANDARGIMRQRQTLTRLDAHQCAVGGRML